MKCGAINQPIVRSKGRVQGGNDIAHWEAAGKVHGEFFGEIRPASTMIEVSRFINPDWLVEIEADAVIGGD